MPTGFRPIAYASALLLALVALSTAYLEVAQSQEARGTAAASAANPAVTRPAYDERDHLRLPTDYREWVFVGSSLGMSYSESEDAMGHEMFHETLMEPGAYRHFVDSGEFADGTQFVLILHGTGESVLPMRQGRFAAEIHGVEMAIKDTSRFEEGWAYFGFGGMGGIRDTAEAFPKQACHDCHAEHAALDNVFLQFYPLLTDAAGVEVALRYVGDESDTGAGDVAGPMAAEQALAAAYAGLDPVMLVAGREEMGKAEIVEDYGGWRYQFASEPNRAAFAADPTRFAPQNTTCPVLPGAAVSPDLFAVHEGRVYTFASVDCRETFESDPTAYVPSDSSTQDEATAG